MFIAKKIKGGSVHGSGSTARGVTKTQRVATDHENNKHCSTQKTQESGQSKDDRQIKEEVRE